MPDDPILWADVKAEYSSSNPNGKDYDNRLFYYSEFWLTVNDNYFITGYSLYWDDPIDVDRIKRFNTVGNFNNTTLDEKSWVKDVLDALLNDLLVYIKQKIF